ncbi:MAG: zinc ribbon domain-containing protein, partial [Cyanobacteria bacterium P01_H01_bin.105]
MASVNQTAMIICPNCNYQNPEAASQCEACYTPLPALVTCSNCGASVQADASFCGQCGHSLANQSATEVMSSAAPPAPISIESVPTTETVPTTNPAESLPAEPVSAEPSLELVEPDPLVSLDPLPVTPPPPLPSDPVSENIPTAIDIYSEP